MKCDCDVSVRETYGSVAGLRGITILRTERIDGIRRVDFEGLTSTLDLDYI